MNEYEMDAILAHFLLCYFEPTEENRTDMKIICSWCRGEGQVGFVGEKAPLEDRRETHGICLDHQRTIRSESGNQGPAQGFDRYAGRDVRCESRALAR